MIVPFDEEIVVGAGSGVTIVLVLFVCIVVEVCRLIVPEGSNEMVSEVLFDPSEKSFDTQIVPSVFLEMNFWSFAVMLPTPLLLNDIWESSIVPPGSS